MLRRILLIAQKETWHILRDSRTLFLALGIPLVFLLLFGYALTSDIEHIPLVLIDHDHSPLARQLSGAFERTGTFTVVAYQDDERGLNDLFHRNAAKVALIIPRGFERAASRGEKAQAQVIVDGTNANEATIAMGYAQAIGQSLSLDLSLESLERAGIPLRDTATPLRLASRNWFNATLKSQWYLVPGLVAVIMSMMTSILMALTVAREWESGTMEQLLATPVRRVEIVFGKIIPYFVIGFLQLIMIAAAGILLFDVPLRGSIGLLCLTSAIFMIGGLAWGLLISIVTRQQQLAMQIALLTTILPSVMLSGFMTPIANMPKSLQVITAVFPARYFLVILRALFLKDLPFSAIWPETAVLLLFATVVLALCALRFRSEVA